MKSEQIRTDKVTTLVRALREENHADFLSASGHRSHVDGAEAATRKRQTIEANCTRAEKAAAWAEAESRGYLT
ncbi:hypothetical protein SK854_30185 [Lentzea sp. BCCO 10_0061]|uniref:Uncharacterized protein n=1 Tax=Lentzea sokolovensis TaxID=3095429 RepID=A0ABU4V4Y5_9PSEU|nr:hypothetical protein [Lentzea sp. BCCO 10_0061]MDX8146417.1 hypothetical protein [Lentzea sp. BCCO 10_0061]